MTTSHPAVESWRPEGNRLSPENRPAGRARGDV